MTLAGVRATAPGMANPRDVVQAILDGRWQHAVAARTACQDGRWGAFVQEITPRPGILSGRREHRRCVERATALFSGPRDGQLEVVPVWIGNSEDEEATTEWYAAHATSLDGEPMGLLEAGPHYEDVTPHVTHHLHARVRWWEVGHVVLTRHYGPGIDLAIRGSTFGVLVGRIIEVLEVTPCDEPPAPRPAIRVPSWCSWIEPRVRDLDPALAAALRELSITTDDEGNLAPRPG